MVTRLMGGIILQFIYTWNHCDVPETNRILHVNYTPINKRICSRGNNLVNQKCYLRLLPKRKRTCDPNSSNTQGTFHKVTQEGSLARTAFLTRETFSCSAHPKNYVHGAKSQCGLVRSALKIHGRSTPAETGNSSQEDIVCMWQIPH